MNLLNETKLIDYLIGGTGIIYMIFAAATTVDPIITSLLLLVINGYIIWRVRHNRLLLILFGIIGYANYGVVSANYLNPIGGTLYTIYSGTKEAHLALIILVAFISIVVCLLPSRIKHFAFGDSLPSKNSVIDVFVTATFRMVDMSIFDGVKGLAVMMRKIPLS